MADLLQPVVDPVDAVVVALLQAKRQRLVGEGFVQVHQLAGAGLVHRHHVVRGIVDKGIGLAVDHIEYGFLLIIKTVVLGFADQLLGDHFTGSANLRSNAVLRIIEVFVGLDLAFQVLANQQGLANDDKGLGEVQAQVAFLGQGHARANHVELVGQQGRDDAVIAGGHQLQLDAHGLGHGFQQVDFEADDLTALVGHFERHIGRVHADAQGTGFHRIIDGTGLSGKPGQRGGGKQNCRKKLFHRRS